MKTKRDLEALLLKSQGMPSKTKHLRLYFYVGMLAIILVLGGAILISSNLRKKQEIEKEEYEVKAKFLLKKYENSTGIYIKALEEKEKNHFEKAKFLLYSVGAYNDSLELFNHIDEERDAYFENESRKKMIAPSEMTSEVATEIVQIAVDTLTKSINLIDEGRDMTSNGKSVEVSDIVDLILGNLEELDQSIIALDTLGFNESINEIKKEGKQLCVEWRDKWWDAMIGILELEEINQAQFETMILRQNFQESLYDLRDWIPKISGEE